VVLVAAAWAAAWAAWTSDPSRHRIERAAFWPPFCIIAAPAGWFCLAPVAVWPDGHGGASGKAGRRAWASRQGTRDNSGQGWRPCWSNTFRTCERREDQDPTFVVRGSPRFDARCDFPKERAARLTSPDPIRQTLIARTGQNMPQETLICRAAFNTVQAAKFPLPHRPSGRRLRSLFQTEI
jgi:hypothetical protein